MPQVRKDILYPGRVRLRDGRIWECTPDDIPHFTARLKEMIGAGLHIPVAWEHQPAAKPMTEEEWEEFLANKPKLTLGEAADAFQHQQGFMEAMLDVASEEAAKQLPATR